MTEASRPPGLELSYRWRNPITVSTIGLLLCLALVVRNRPTGWPTAAAALVLLWLVLLAVIWRRTRAYLAVDGADLLVRTFRRVHRIPGPDVLVVRERMSPSGASYVLSVVTPSGPRRQAVPTALLRKGHSTLFTWILTWAPRAELDQGSRRTLEDLQDRGLVSRTVPTAPDPITPPEQERAHRG